MVKKFSLLLVLLLLIFAVIGCSSGASNEGSSPSSNGVQVNENGEEIIELRFAWWGTQVRHDRTQEVIKLFEEQNPNIKIKVEFTGWDGYWEKLATQAAGQNLPDLIQISYAYLAEYVDRGLIGDLTPYVENGVINTEHIDDLYLDVGKIDDKLYAVNLGANAFTIVYDPAMFQEAGIQEPQPGYTYEDLANMAREIQTKLPDVDYGVSPFDHIDAFKHYLRQHGEWLYNEDNTALGYDDDQITIDFFSYWTELLDDGVAAPQDVVASVQSVEDELIVHGKSPLFATNSNSLVGLMTSANRPLKLMIYPTLPGGEDAHFIAPSQYISMTSNSKHPEAAAKFIDFLTNDVEANDILLAERGVPISSEIRDHLYPKLDEATKETFTYLELVQEHSQPVDIIDPPGGGEIRELFDRIAEAVNFGELSPEEAAEQFRKEADAILQKFNK